MFAPTRALHLPFRFDLMYQLLARPFGIHPDTAWVEIDPDRFEVRFGRWRVSTPIDNISGVGVSGPYGVITTVGPAHLSATDRGLTFATNRDLGACLTFHRSLRGIDPLGLIRHPGLTVTVAEPELLAAALHEHGVARSDRRVLHLVQQAEDDLVGEVTADR